MSIQIYRLFNFSNGYRLEMFYSKSLRYVLLNGLIGAAVIAVVSIVFRRKSRRSLQSRKTEKSVPAAASNRKVRQNGIYKN